MATETPRENSVILWQKGTEDDPIANPALLIEPYSDSICITQEERLINLNYESLPELIKVLKEMYKNRG